MRKPDKVDPGSQYVLGSLGELKHTELLVTEAITLNSVAVKNAGVRRQARQDRRECIPLGPVENLGQCRPIWLLAQVGLTRLGSGDDDRVEAVVPKLL